MSRHTHTQTNTRTCANKHTEQSFTFLWNQEVDKFRLLRRHVDVGHQDESVGLIDWHDGLSEEKS